MKFQRTQAFDRDLRRLSSQEIDLFRQVARRAFHAAAERKATDPAARWPRNLRVRPLRAVPGVWEMTWSFSGPDCRATFEWIEIEGEPAVRWRRIGGHEIFDEP